MGIVTSTLQAYRDCLKQAFVLKAMRSLVPVTLCLSILTLFLTAIQSSMGVSTKSISQESVFLLNLIDKGRPVLFNQVRFDGGGSVVLNMIFAAAYAYYRGWAYGGVFTKSLSTLRNGVVRHGEDLVGPMNFTFGHNRSRIFQESHIATAATNNDIIKVEYVRPMVKGKSSLEDIVLSAAVGLTRPTQVILFNSVSFRLQDILPFSLLSIDGETTIHNVTEYGSMTTPEFLADLRAPFKAAEVLGYYNCCMFKAGVPSVAIHIRRGSVDATDILRYTENSYYIDIINRIRSVYPQADIHAFSSIEKWEKSDYTDIYDAGVPIHFEEDVPLLQSWVHFIKADIFVMAKSAFSEVPALLSQHCVVYEPFHVGRLPHWVTILELTKDYIRSCYPSIN